MKYLVKREEFIRNNGFSNYSLIKEDSGPLANDIAWGDSLLGRLINSVSRKAQIGVNLTRIDSLVDRLRESFNSLLENAKIKGAELGQDTIAKIDMLKISAMIGVLKKSIDQNDSKEEISRTAKSTISNIESLMVSKSVDPIKKEVLSKLNEFLKMTESSSENGEESQTQSGENVEDKKSTKDLPAGKEVKELPVGKEGDKKVKELPIGDDNREGKKEKIKSKIESLKKIIEEKKKKGEDTKTEETELVTFERGLGNIGESCLNNYLEFILLKENEDNSPDESDQVENKGPENKGPENKEEVKDSSEKEEVGFKMHWTKIFDSEYMKKWTFTDEEVKKLELEVDKLTKDSTKIVIDGIDPIIEIVRIFNRAYKIHTTSVIPSGRSGGKVSNKTFREYSSLGSGEGGTPDSPGSGPWRNNTLFDKWESGVLDIIKDSKYQVLFNEDTTIKVGSADPRLNVSKSGDRKVQGGGKTLLTFMNAMIDGSKLYKSGAQSKFIEEYFNVEVPSDSLGWSGGKGNDVVSNSKVANKAVKDTGKRKYFFKPVKDISPDFTKTFYAIKTNDGAENKKYYMYVSNKDENYVYVKYSESFFPINKYASNVAEITKGEMDSIQMRERKKENNELFETFYGRIQKKKFPIKPGSILELKAVSMDKSDLSGKEKIKSETPNLGNVKEIHGVLSEDNKLFTLPEDKAKSTSSKDEKYKDLLK